LKTGKKFLKTPENVSKLIKCTCKHMDEPKNSLEGKVGEPIFDIDI
jgi:hypothetical protein